MARHYLDQADADSKWTLPNLEVFYAEHGDLEIEGLEDGEQSGAGWYYWFCMPGCLPDSDPFGPYASESEAVTEARELHSD